MSRIWMPPRRRDKLPDSEAAKPTWLELFYDLVFVAVFIQIGDMLSRDVSMMGFAKVLVLFAPIWWVWANVAWYMNHFDVDDVWHRLLLLCQIFFVAWMGLSVPDAFGDSSTQFVLCYIGFRLTMIAMYWRSLAHAPGERELLVRYIMHFHAAGAVLWGLSLLLPPDVRPVVWVATFLWEAYSALAPRLLALLERFPVHIHHLVERFGTLIILVLGETFIKTVTVQPPPPMTAVTVMFSAPAVITFFGLWWLYFAAVDGGHEAEGGTGGILRPENPVPWLFTHLPLALVLIVLAIAKTKLFESVVTGYLNPTYSAMYLGSLGLFFVLLTIVAGDRSRRATLSRLAAAMAFAVLIPIAIVWRVPATPLAVLATVIVAAQVARETWPRRAAAR